jgi:nucleotide-binding universal stress UspA family protein
MMTYATLMVHLGVGRSNGPVLEVAATLAARFGAGVIGIAACHPLEMLYGDGFVAGDIVDVDRAEVDRQVGAAEAEFRDTLAKRAHILDWRSAVSFEPGSNYLAQEVRSADLLLTGVEPPDSLLAHSSDLYLGDLVMQIGRPILVVPPAGKTAGLDRVLIGWKDSPETRRAALDALPLLKKASYVAVAEIARDNELAAAEVRVGAVVSWLKRHGVDAEPIVRSAASDDSSSIDALAEEKQVNVVVAGAYGHSRLREWVLGGVTRDNLLRPRRCVLVSH